MYRFTTGITLVALLVVEVTVNKDLSIIEVRSYRNVTEEDRAAFFMHIALRLQCIS